MLIVCSPLLTFIDLLSSSIKFMLKFRKSIKDNVLNEKDKCLLLFICSCSVNDTFTHRDFRLYFPSCLFCLNLLSQVYYIFYHLS